MTVGTLVTGLLPGLRFRTKGQLASDIVDDARAYGVTFYFVAGDDVYGNCTELRGYLEQARQGYVLRVASPSLSRSRLARVTCTDAAKRLLNGTRRWQVRSAGKGSKGERWYEWAWLATASPRHTLLVRCHRRTGELAFHYCYVP